MILFFVAAGIVVIERMAEYPFSFSNKAIKTKVLTIPNGGNSSSN